MLFWHCYEVKRILETVNSNVVENLIKQFEESTPAAPSDLSSAICKEIVVNALKCKTDSLDVLDLKIINKVMTEFRNAARIFKPYRHIRKVSIFG
jgi:hypothetical protein